MTLSELCEPLFVYVCRLNAGASRATEKLLIVK